MIHPLTRQRLNSHLASLMTPIEFPRDYPAKAARSVPEASDRPAWTKRLPASLFDPAALDRAAAAFRHMPKRAALDISAAQLFLMIDYSRRRRIGD